MASVDACIVLCFDFASRGFISFSIYNYAKKRRFICRRAVMGINSIHSKIFEICELCSSHINRNLAFLLMENMQLLDGYLLVFDFNIFGPIFRPKIF